MRMKNGLAGLLILILIGFASATTARASGGIWPFSLFKTRHTVTVINGTGGGSYLSGTKVTISALNPAAVQGAGASWTFSAWLVILKTRADLPAPVIDPNAATTVLTMPDADVIVQATYWKLTP